MSTTIIVNSSHPRVQEITVPANLSGEAMNDLLAATQAEYLLLTLAGGAITFGARTLERFVQLADDTGAAWVYSDFREVNEKGETSDHPLIDQIRVVYCGSIKTAVDMKLMIFDPAAPGTWPGINFPLIALVKNGKIIDAYYESSSDFLDKSVFDYDNDQVRLYLLRRSGGMRVMNFVISDNMISVVKTEMINSR